jgi:hypothetical protein
MYHSPGLRDGVSNQGTCVRPCPPEVLGAESIRTRFTSAGNKFGRPQVHEFAWDCAWTLFERNSRKMYRTFLALHGVGLLYNGLNRLL